MAARMNFRRYNANDFTWHSRGNCRHMDSSFFLAEGKEAIATAKSYCVKSACPVLEICREYAILKEEKGVFGGTSAEDRRKIRRQRGIKLQATA